MITIGSLCGSTKLNAIPQLSKLLLESRRILGRQFTGQRRPSFTSNAILIIDNVPAVNGKLAGQSFEEMRISFNPKQLFAGPGGEAA